MTMSKIYQKYYQLFCEEEIFMRNKFSIFSEIFDVQGVRYKVQEAARYKVQ